MRHSTKHDMFKALKERFVVPKHIEYGANMLRYDMLFGPQWCKIPAAGIEAFSPDDVASFPTDIEDVSEGDKVQEAWDSDIANAVREYIDALPSEMWYDSFSDELFDSEPELEAWEDDDGERFEPDYSEIYTVEHSDIVEALFGKTIAREGL